MNRIYTFGYASAEVADLVTLARDGALILDIRFNPTSRRPEWRQAALADFARYASVYRSFSDGGQTPAQRSLWRLLDALETSVMMPLVLGVLTLPEPGQADGMCAELESYLGRRMVCGGTLASLNRLTVDVLNRLEKDGWTQEVLRTALLELVCGAK